MEANSKTKKPWYKIWWVWVIIFFVIGSVFNRQNENENKQVDANWEKLRNQGYDVGPMTDEERRRIQNKSADALTH